MLELIFQGFIEWTYGLILECWEYFSSMLLNVMSMDFAYLKERMPVIQPVMQTMLALGWALLIGNLVFQAARSMMTGLGFEAEDPKLLFGRTFVFSFLLVASPQICNIALNMTSTVINMLEIPDAVDIKFADKSSFAGLSASWLLVVICGIVVMFQSLKLILEMAERYFTVAAYSDAAAAVENGRNIVWISIKRLKPENLSLAKQQFYAQRQEDGSHRFFGANQ